jgi:hypothetical protein
MASDKVTIMCFCKMAGGDSDAIWDVFFARFEDALTGAINAEELVPGSFDDIDDVGFARCMASHEASLHAVAIHGGAYVMPGNEVIGFGGIVGG